MRPEKGRQPRSYDQQSQPAMASSSALQDGEQTACALPSTLRVPISERARCLPSCKALDEAIAG